MSLTTASNPYSKAKVLAACKSCLEDIYKSRALRKGQLENKLISRWFGLSNMAALEVLCMHGFQESVIERVMLAVQHCEGDTINLTQQEFEKMANYWPKDNIGM